jgi:hypothetical protein
MEMKMGEKMKLVFLLEEKSMKCFLDGILPNILPEGIAFQTIPHSGKSDLQKSIPIKLAAWNEPDVKFVIVQDQDSNDCRELKKQLLQLCDGTKRVVLIRIACHELESWYFGDLEAVSLAYNKDLSKIIRKKKYRIPDDIISPKHELQVILPEHQQIDGAKRIAKYIEVERNTSVSFQMLVRGIRELLINEGNDK